MRIQRVDDNIHELLNFCFKLMGLLHSFHKASSFI
jgi:hypothetical protein